MFHMSNDSDLFRTQLELEEKGFELVANKFVKDDEVWLPLYEAKMMWQFDHRFGTYKDVESRSSTHIPTPTPEQHANPSFIVQPWYWVSGTDVRNAFPKEYSLNFWLVYRFSTSPTNERTLVSAIIPFYACNHILPIIYSSSVLGTVILSANLNSVVADYCVRLKMGRQGLDFFIAKQLPILPPDVYSKTNVEFIVPRVLELVYTAWDMRPFADDVWRESDKNLRELLKKQWEENRDATGGHSNHEPPEWIEVTEDGIPFAPFKWDEDRRAILRAELDAYFAQLYGLNEEELRYILDPTDIFGEDYPGETFRVLKEKEIKEYGEYRTRRLVLEAWEKLR